MRGISSPKMWLPDRVQRGQKWVCNGSWDGVYRRWGSGMRFTEDGRKKGGMRKKMRCISKRWEEGWVEEDDRVYLQEEMGGRKWDEEDGV